MVHTGYRIDCNDSLGCLGAPRTRPEQLQSHGFALGLLVDLGVAPPQQSASEMFGPETATPPWALSLCPRSVANQLPGGRAWLTYLPTTPLDRPQALAFRA